MQNETRRKFDTTKTLSTEFIKILKKLVTRKPKLNTLIKKYEGVSKLVNGQTVKEKKKIFESLSKSDLKD